jgi:TonB family protein
MKALYIAGVLCAAAISAVCQDDPGAQIAERAQMVAANPRSSLAHYRLGEVYFQQNSYQSAANEFREALNGDRALPWIEARSHIQLGRIFDSTGQHDRAVNEYRQAQKTGDNTDGALDDATTYLKLAGQATDLPSVWSGIVNGALVAGPILKTEPEYTDEARLAGLEGTVLLRGTIGEDGSAHDLTVLAPLGLGLDEKAIEAVKLWRFQPASNQGLQHGLPVQIAVSFRMSPKQSRWHLIQVQFEAPQGTARPVVISAQYPVGAGIGPEAMEEGRLVAAVGRLATARLTFDVDEQGLPVHFQVPNASEAIWGSEAEAVVGQWRFTPGMKNGVAVAVPCTVELVWGARQLDESRLAQVYETLATR